MHETAVHVELMRRCSIVRGVNRGNYYVAYYSNGLMDDTSATAFEPNANMTRAQRAAMLMRSMQLESSDVQ